MKDNQQGIDKEALLPVLEFPNHLVVETDDELTIDGFPINFVLENGVKVKQLSKKCVEVNITFLAKSYEFKK